MNIVNTKKTFSKSLISTLILLLILTATSSPVFSYTKDNMDITFALPAEEELIELPAYASDDNIDGYSDANFNSVMIIMSDIYYTLGEQYPDLTKDEIANRYPKEELWLGCGIFDDKWNNQDYMLGYLEESVNSGTNQYTCSIETLEIDGLPVYKFTYMAQEGNPESSGGTIYFTLYKSKTYLVEFSNYFNYSKSLPYAEAFENSVGFKAIDSFGFVHYSSGTLSMLIIIAAAIAAVLIITGVLYFIYKQKGKK